MKKILIMLLICTLALVGCNKSEEKKNKDSNNSVTESKPVSFEEQTIDGISISGFNLNEESGTTNVLAYIKNTNETDTYVRIINAYLYDKNENLIGETYFYIDSTLKSGVENIYQSGFASDVTSAVSVKFEIEK